MSKPSGWLPLQVPRVVWCVVAGRVVNRVGAFTLPFLAIFLTRERGMSATAVGVILAAFGVATIPSRLAGGYLADNLGRRTTMLTGLIGCALSQLALAAVDGIGETVVSVIVLGLFFELYEPPSQALIADAVAAPDRAGAYGLLSAGLAAAGMLAGLFAALLTQVDLRLLFVVDAMTCLACAILLRISLPPERSGRGSPLLGEESVHPWRDARLLVVTAIGTVFAVVYLQVIVSLPLTLLARGLDPSTLGVLLTTSAATIVVGQPLLRWRPVRDSNGPGLLVVGYLLLGCGLVGYGLARSLLMFALATSVSALGDLLLMGRLFAIVSALAPVGGRARYLAVFGLSWGAAAVVAPLAGALLLTQIGILGTWSISAGFCLMLAVVQPVVSPRLAPSKRLVQGSLAG